MTRKPGKKEKSKNTEPDPANWREPSRRFNR